MSNPVRVSVLDQAPQPPVLRPGRALHVLDLENLNRSAKEQYTHLPAIWSHYVGLNDVDLLTVGVDASGAFRAHDAFPSAGLVTGRGESGADRALVRRLTATVSTGRFDTLIIGSGDHEFTPSALAAHDVGLYVVVVSRWRSLAPCLQAAADRVVWLPDDAFPTAEATGDADPWKEAG